jgi:Transcriptional regulator
MELRQLQYAAQLAADKNFTRAAEKLHIAQPSLSQQLSKLEKELGVLLFRRSTNSVELTYAGSRFVEHAQQILDMVEQLKQEMEDISQLARGQLTIGSLPITGSHVLPLVLPVFQAEYPGIEIILTEDTSANLEMLAIQGKTDLSLLTLPLPEPSLSYEPLIEEEICLAVPPTHPAAIREPVRNDGQMAVIPLSEMRQEPFITLKQGQGFRQIAIDLCKRAGFTPRIVFESTNIETVQALVAAGMGVALVPEMITRTARNRFTPVYFRLQGAPTRTVVIAYKSGRYLSKAAEAFIKTATEVVGTARRRGDI